MCSKRVLDIVIYDTKLGIIHHKLWEDSGICKDIRRKQAFVTRFEEGLQRPVTSYPHTELGNIQKEVCLSNVLCICLRSHRIPAGVYGMFAGVHRFIYVVGGA